jgi:hypothetical protein
MISNICRTLNPNLTSSLRGELQSYTDHIVSTCVEKLGDNLQKIRNSAEEALLSMSEHPLFGVQTCLNVLTRAAPPVASKDTKKAMLSSKHIIGKYSVLLKML